MDNSSPDAWATPKPVVAALVVGTIVLAAATVFAATDTTGRVLIGLATVAMAALAVLAGVQRPKLAVVGDELRIRTLRGTRAYHRDDVLRVRVVPYPRLGRRVPMIEVDVRTGPELGQDDAPPGERLLIFGRWDLGTDPRTVFERLDQLGYVPED